MRITSHTSVSSQKLRLVQMLKALGNPIRFQIVEALAERRMCITAEIVDLLPLAQSTVSQHLNVLKEAGLIRGEIDGPSTCYCLDAENIRWLKIQIENWLPGCCEQWSEDSGSLQQRINLQVREKEDV